MSHPSYLLTSISRHVIVRNQRLLLSSHLITKRLCNSSNNSEKKDASSKSEKENKAKEKAKKKMNELLMSLSQKTYSKEEEIKIYKPEPKKQEKLTDESKKEVVVDFAVKRAVKDVAELLGGDHTKTEKELLNSVQSHSTSFENLRNILSNMRTATSDDSSKERRHGGPVPRSRYYESGEGRREVSYSRAYKKIDLFNAPPLNIFPKDLKPEGKESILDGWNASLEKQKKFAVTQPPRNYFEEMIKWTDGGKIWKFPIDNEMGFEEKYTFADHIFLEKHLEGWCPGKGPIRHFMELVCIGLSKNPYITVDRKKSHIEWYKNYFDSKKDLLKDLGAL